MSSPSPDCPASLSASGYEDGLGRRTLVFDREAGDTVERLALRPELAAFERVLTERAARLADFDDVRIGRPRSVRRDPETMLVVVDSAFVPGTRLADAIDIAADGADEGAAAGIDVAVGLLLEMLPALGAFHTGAGMRHGVVGPGRTMLTADGRVVLLDVIFADAVQRLQCGAPRLWSAFGLAVTPGPGPARLDAAMDLSQAGLAALMLVLGRPLGRQAFSSQFPAAFSEAMEIAHIRGSAAFAAHFERFMRRLLPFPDRRTFASAQDAFDDLRDIAGAEIGIATCRAALVSLAQTAVTGPATLPAFSQPAIAPRPVALAPRPVAPAPAAPARVERPAIEVRPPASAPPVLLFSHVMSPAPAESGQPRAVAIATPGVSDAPAPAAAASPVASRAIEPAVVDVRPRLDARSSTAGIAVSEPVTQQPITVTSSPEPAAPIPPAPAAAPDPPALSAAANSARRKRSRGGPRAKRDKLRSHAVPPAPLLAPVKAPAPDPVPAPMAAPVQVVPLTPPPSLVPPATLIPVDPAPRLAVAPIRMPFAGSVELRPEASSYASERLWEAPEPVAKPGSGPIPLADSNPHTARPAGPVAQPGSAAHAPLRIKPDPPVKHVSGARSAARTSETAGSMLFAAHGQPAPRAGRPWKAAAAAIVLIAAGLAGGWGYLSGRDPSTVTAAPKPTPAAVVEPGPVAAPASSAGGTIEITSTPSGAKVLLDGAAVGVTPVTLSDVPPGRRVVTLVSSAGTVRRTVRVQAGGTAVLDVPVYSGFVTISAPVILEVAVGGRSIGTTEQGRLLLPPGRHELTLSNRDLDYLATHMVEIESGEEFRTRVDPRGKVSINAVPWAEVWVDGRRAGETPLANLSLPLGTHDVVFKHPQFGERRLTTTLKASASATLSVDFTRPDGGNE